MKDIVSAIGMLYLLVTSFGTFPLHTEVQTADGSTKVGTCTIRGNVVWKYNEYVGTKADVGAKVLLLRRFEPKLSLSPLLDKTDRDKGAHVTEVDMLGKYEIGGLPPGSYDLLILSKNTTRKFTIKFDPLLDYAEHNKAATERMVRRAEKMIAGQDSENPASEISDISDGIEYLNYEMFKEYILIPHFAEKDYEVVAALLLRTNKFLVRGKLKLVAGESLEINADFGNTYI
jgi:hypothetical protein